MDAPLPHATQALLDLVAKMAEQGTTPEEWAQLGAAVVRHAGWLEHYLHTVEKRPDSIPLMHELLGPILEQLQRVMAHLSPSTQEWLEVAYQPKTPSGQPS